MQILVDDDGRIHFIDNDSITVIFANAIIGYGTCENGISLMLNNGLMLKFEEVSFEIFERLYESALSGPKANRPPGEGWSLFQEVTPNSELSHIEVWRKEWGSSHVASTHKVLSTYSDVTGLWWRPA